MNHAGERWDGDIICSGDSEKCDCQEGEDDCVFDGGGICYCQAVELAIERGEK